MYGYSSYGPDLFSLLGFAGGIWLSLTFIAFIAAIVCTVLLYKKYVSSFDKNQLKNAKHDFGPFLRFEKFWSEKILIVLFIYNMCFIAFGSAAAVISLLSMLTYDVGSVFIAILTVVVLFVLSEVLNRLFYEFFMLIVKMWRNTQDIRSAVVGNDASESASVYCGPVQEPYHQVSVNTQGSAFVPDSANADQRVAASEAVDFSKTNPLPVVQTPPQQGVLDQNSSWSCPSCGASNKAGVFCSQCGMRRS